jgi:hypothetical protein
VALDTICGQLQWGFMALPVMAWQWKQATQRGHCGIRTVQWFSLAVSAVVVNHDGGRHIKDVAGGGYKSLLPLHDVYGTEQCKQDLWG